MSDYRIEKDTLGEVNIPINVLYGAQTQRAIENFQISSYKTSRAFIWSIGIIKHAAASINFDLGYLDESISRAIIDASIEVTEGKWDDQFLVDIFQAGAGTSLHMNANEVVANRATIILGGAPGDYLVHPNNHVNMSQSTNDVIPTAIRLGCLSLLNGLIQTVTDLSSILSVKADEFNSILKSGRTHLQDAVPVRLGQEFRAYARAVKRDCERINNSSDGLYRLGIGGTATGSGLNTHPEYRFRMVDKLNQLTSLSLIPADDLFESMQSMADFVDLSSSMRTLALTLTRIANDLRLLSSGPNTGINEINLPPVQPGSSIMPGKINPVMAEMLNMAMYHVLGCDTTIAYASQAGQLELNVMMPIIAHHLFEMIQIMTTSITTFSSKCVSGITADLERSRFWLDRNPIIVTILNPIIGYNAGAELVKMASQKNQSISQLAIEEAKKGNLINISNGKPVKPEEIHEALGDLMKMTDGGIIPQA